MVPIFEQGEGRGIGHSFDSFIDRFDDICGQHAEQPLAFVFYDFHDKAIRSILKDQGVFARLDRLSRERLSIFYLHSGRRYVKRFNDSFTSVLGVHDVPLPCVVFCRWNNQAFTDVSVVPLESSDLIHGFHELYGVIEEFIARKPIKKGGGKYLRWIPNVAREVGRETLRAALKAGFDSVRF